MSFWRWLLCCMPRPARLAYAACGERITYTRARWERFWNRIERRDEDE